MADSEQGTTEGRFNQRMTSTKDAITSVVGMSGAILIAILIIACAIGIPLAMVIVGVEYKDDCPAEEKIPIYLIVAGVTTLFLVPFSIMSGTCAKSAASDKSGVFGVFIICNGILMVILSLFAFAWFICGNVWVFRNYEPNYDDKHSPDYCHKTVYLFAFSIIIITYICSFLSCCCSCCFKRRSGYADIE